MSQIHSFAFLPVNPIETFASSNRCHCTNHCLMWFMELVFISGFPYLLHCKTSKSFVRGLAWMGYRYFNQVITAACVWQLVVKTVIHSAWIMHLPYTHVCVYSGSHAAAHFVFMVVLIIDSIHFTVSSRLEWRVLLDSMCSLKAFQGCLSYSWTFLGHFP